MVPMESHWYLLKVIVLYGSEWLLWKVYGCNLVTGCYGNSLDAMESYWVLKKFMVDMESK
jgi:hypothetical protein